MKDQLKKHIAQIKQLTEKDKISWDKHAEDTFIWKTLDTNKEKVNIIIKDLNESGDEFEHYLFRMYKPDTKTVKMDTVITLLDEDLGFSEIKALFRLLVLKYQLGDLDYLGDLLNEVE